MNDPELKKLRADYAIAENTIRDTGRMEKMSQFFSGHLGHV